MISGPEKSSFSENVQLCFQVTKVIIQVIWRPRTQSIAAQTFSRLTSELEGTGLVSFQILVTDGY